MAVEVNFKEVYEDIKQALLRERDGLKELGLASVCFGSDQASSAYITSQQKLAQELNVNYKVISLASDVSLHEATAQIESLNKDKKINGIIINRPLPSQVEADSILGTLDYKKDIEGMHPDNLGRLMGSKPLFISPTVRSVMECLKQAAVQLYGKKVIIVNNSVLIGKPLAMLLTDEFATVNIAHIATAEKGDLPHFIKEADVVVTAVGKPDVIKAEWIKNGAIVIDVGTGAKDGKLAGDVEFDKAKEKALFITPVPGGVGKLTPLFLFANLFKAKELF
jgi:methylenetetrahydrofolate dehydrogenase (NADP+)/methenyltetrahydrofolate cyclohydrolase